MLTWTQNKKLDFIYNIGFNLFSYAKHKPSGSLLVIIKHFGSTNVFDFKFQHNKYNNVFSF